MVIISLNYKEFLVVILATLFSIYRVFCWYHEMKDLWQIKFAEDNFADNLDDHFRTIQFKQIKEGNVFIN